MKQRPYQIEATRAVLAAFDGGHRATLLWMATGTGKTHIMVALAEHYSKDGLALILAPRELLVHQAAEKVYQITGTMPSIEMGEQRHTESLFGGNIVVGTLQTQIAGRGEKKRMHRDEFDPSKISLVIIDEAHLHYDTIDKIYSHYSQNPSTRFLLVTATPKRHDGRSLKKFCSHCAYKYAPLDAINDGWLVESRPLYPNIEVIDISMIKKTAGDFNTRELSQRMSDDGIALKTAASLIETYAGRCTLVFCVDTAHANKMTWALTNPSTGIPGCAKALHYKAGNDDEIRAIKDEFKAGMFPILVTVDMASYGFDVPKISLIRMCRPTLSMAIVMQQIGRGSRPLPGVVDGLETADKRKRAIALSEKPFCEVHDDAYNTKNPKLATIGIVDAFAGDTYTKEDIRKATVALQSKRTPGSIVEELERAKRFREEREKRERDAIQSVAVKTKTTFEKGELFSLIGVSAPMYGVERNGKMASPKQLDRIRKIFKAEPPNLTLVEARRIIVKWSQDLKAGNVSVRQRMYLRKPPFGMNDREIDSLNMVPGEGFRRASSIMSARWGKKQ